MAAPQNVIAVVFDFDDTLTDDSTTKLLETHGIDPRDFWENRMRELTDVGWDAPLAYLKLILDQIGDGKPFGRLTNEKLREFGKSLEFYCGIPELFEAENGGGDYVHEPRFEDAGRDGMAGWPVIAFETALL
jgi:hypothetical protein